ncbi:sirohydrochlorin cobaltochelatase [Sanguibacteroides justesenii]|uniref:Cobalt chelatase n=1 Tax=Sanguibacteroides justesenii TaxID=1547597 RepID=A0AB34R386_9PORP|nr:sirohydrochlorin cobaltochelatase [Sanguibacteroides justesenii]KIO45512.1 cobalt chelatase [Sanguibacteroides justesenii]
MKNILFVILLLLFHITLFGHGEGFKESDIFKTVGPNDKIALLVVHFGTTHDDTRALTIDAINQKMKKEFQTIEVREAYTSRMIIRRLKEKGVRKPNPTEALNKLATEGYTHIIIQSTNIIEGVEMESLRRDAAQLQSKFKDIRIGNPLLYSPEDYLKAIKAIAAELKGKTKGECVFVCHGTYHPGNASYGMLDYMMKAEGHKNYHIGTIEGYPTFENVLSGLKSSGSKEVTLIPFMFVAGDHTKNDIAKEWKEKLEKNGYRVSLFLKGLGEHSRIQDIFIQHARYAATHKKEDIVTKKKKYEISDDIE